jgi:N-acetylmuramoyl-L-alanine amidase
MGAVVSARLWLLCLALLLTAVSSSGVSGQAPAASLSIIAREPHRPIPVTTQNGQDLVALEDLAASFQASFREDPGALTLTYRGRTVALTPDQTLASVAGRVISLPSPPVRVNGRWLVPLDFISRALAGIYDARIELRRASRLIILGDLRVPRVTVRHEPSGSGARVSVDLLPRAAATVTRDQPDRLAVRIDAEALDAAFPAGQLAGFVQGYRIIEPTTIVIELGPRFASFRSTVQVADASNTLLIDLLPQEGAPPPASTQAEPPPPVAPAEVPALLSATSRTIVIDAGHGGDDRGAVGGRGAAEKDVALALARRLKAAIEARIGVRVLMTRDADQLVAVSDRPALANNNKASLFISLHANGALRPTATGATVYVAAFASDSLAAKTAAPPRLPAYGGGVRDIELVPWNLAQAGHRDASELFAGMLVEAFRDRIPTTANPIARAPLRVLQSANMPAVLIEAGFLTNADQERALTSADYQSALAQSIVDAIVRFRGVPGEDRP